MNPVPFILLAISLPLLLGGCGEKEVDSSQLVERNDIKYLVNSETPYTGKQIEFHENGQKQWEENYKDGKPDGLVVEWYTNGQKKVEGNYKDGKEGLHVSWYTNGQKQAEVNYKDGKIDGLSVWWDVNGQKEGEVNYKDGKKVEGSEKFWSYKGEPVDSEEE